MVVRQPRPRRPARRASRVRDVPAVTGIALVLAAFWLRAILSLFAVAEWLAAWRLVNALTTPFIGPLEALPLLERSLVGRMTIAEVLAVLVATVGALFSLASLSIRRSPS